MVSLVLRQSMVLRYSTSSAAWGRNMKDASNPPELDMESGVWSCQAQTRQCGVTPATSSPSYSGGLRGPSISLPPHHTGRRHTTSRNSAPLRPSRSGHWYNISFGIVHFFSIGLFLDRTEVPSSELRELAVPTCPFCVKPVVSIR